MRAQSDEATRGYVVVRSVHGIDPRMFDMFADVRGGALASSLERQVMRVRCPRFEGAFLYELSAFAHDYV